MDTYKSKQYLFVLLKVIVVIAALGFVFESIQSQDAYVKAIFKENFLASPLFQVQSILLLLLLSFFNWAFEILKWQVLTTKLKTNSFLESSKQVLIAHTSSLFTPFKIGEYGAKTLYYSKNQTKKVVFLNFLGNMTQMSITFFFGLIGLFFFLKWNFKQWLNLYVLFLILGCLFFFIGRRWFSKQGIRCDQFSINKAISFIKTIPQNDRVNILALSTARYLTFSFQFCFLLSLFTPISWWAVLPLVFTMYLLSSLLPMFQFFDFAIKGGAAVLVFTAFSPQIVFAVVFIMWLLNAVLPALVGSYLLLLFDTNRLLKPVKK